MNFLSSCVAALALALTTTLPAVEPATDAREEVQHLESQLQQAPKSLPLLSAAGDAHLFLGEAHRAVECFEKMIENDPALDAPHWRLGIAYYLDGQWAKSSRQFAKYHLYDGRDRENGLWKFLADVKLHGVEKARTLMLEYHAFDRDPFPWLYDLYAGKLTPAQFAERLEEQTAKSDPRVRFNALYYAGLCEEVRGNHAAAQEKTRAGVALFDEDSAESGGPGYMWKVARVHLRMLEGKD